MGKLKYTNETFFDICKDVHNNIYEYFYDYSGITNKIKIKCKKHGIFEQQASVHKAGSGCPYCAGQKFKIEELKEDFENKGYEVLSEIKGKTAEVFVKCSNGHTFETSHHKMFTSAGRYTECFECSYLTRAKTKEKLGIQTPQEQLSDKELYKHLVWKETNKTVKTREIHNIDKRSIDFHLDHIISIYDGFRKCILPYVLGNYHNIRIIGATANRSKNRSSEMTLTELINLIEGSTTIPEGSTLK